MEYIDINKLKPLDNNPRIISSPNFDMLCYSITNNPEYFEARPIIVSNRTGENVIIAGNQRYRAAKTLKLKKVPVFIIQGLTEEKEREIIVRDNVSNGAWDYDILANEWDAKELNEWGLNVWDVEEDEVEEKVSKDKEAKDESNMIVITLTDEEREEWLTVKESIGIMKDKKAFFEILKIYSNENIVNQ